MQETTLNITKGAKVDLTKTNPGLKIAHVGLGWDINSGNAGSFDLDVFALCLIGGKLTKNSDVIYFSNKTGVGVTHMGDNLTGAGDGDDETLKFDLNAIPADVNEILIAVNIYDADSRRQNFGHVRNAYARVYDADTNQEIVRYDLSEDFSSNTGVIVGKIYRHNAEWKFQAEGTGKNGNINQISDGYR